jgi:hypothetical protein
MAHDGSVQVHGNRSILLDSEKWNEPNPLTALQGHHLLSGLIFRVENNYNRDFLILQSENAFNKHHDWYDRIARNGGHGPYKYTWPKPSRKDQRRVDTNIDRGRAFV